jgi:hypothetical protein
LKQNTLRFIALCLKLYLILNLGFYSQPATAAVILQYHHVSSETPPITRVTTATLIRQMNYLKDQHFTVISLTQLLKQLRNR